MSGADTQQRASTAAHHEADSEEAAGAAERSTHASAVRGSLPSPGATSVQGDATATQPHAARPNTRAQRSGGGGAHPSDSLRPRSRHIGTASRSITECVSL